MFMMNTQLMEMNQLYKIDSLLYNQCELNDNLTFSFNKQNLKHQLGWDILVVRYRFSRKIYRTLFECEADRYERLFRALFQYQRVKFALRQTQHSIMHFCFVFTHKHKLARFVALCSSPRSSSPESEDHSLCIQQEQLQQLFTSLLTMLNALHFLFFHMFTFSSKMYQHFGSQICSAWNDGSNGQGFGQEFHRKQTNIEQFVRKHEKFIGTIESIVFFGQTPEAIALYAALNDAMIDFCESFCDEELFPFLTKLNDGLVATSVHNAGDLTQNFVNVPLDLIEAWQTLLECIQFKVSIHVSKYRCCMTKFVKLAMKKNYLQFKFDILTYQPCLDQLFAACTKT